MINNSRVVLEDDNCYKVVDKIKDIDKAYVYLINSSDKDDLVIRKEIDEDDSKYLVGLDDEKEDCLSHYIDFVTNIFEDSK